MNGLPLHSSIVIWYIAISTAACFLACLLGGVIRRTMNILPPVPQFPGTVFPHIGAYFYTAVFILTFAMASVHSIRQPRLPQTDVVDFILSMLVQIALYVPFLVMYFTLPRQNRPETSILRKSAWILAGLAAVGLCGPVLELSGFTRWLIRTTQCPEYQDVVTALTEGDPAVRLCMAFMAIIVAPVTEECCFRGFVYNILRRWTCPLVGCICSALLFSAIHCSLAQAVPLFIFGIVQCIAYEKARSLWLPITLHTLFNAFNVLIILLVLS